MLDTSHGAARAASGPDATTARHGRVAALAIGDLCVFLIFVVIGRSSHKEAQTAALIARTAAPFVLGWFIAAPWLGAFGRLGSAATTRPRPLLARTAVSWAVAWALAMLIRGLGFRDIVAPAFAAIALVFNAIVLLGWRGLAAWLWSRTSGAEPSANSHSTIARS